MQLFLVDEVGSVNRRSGPRLLASYLDLTEHSRTIYQKQHSSANLPLYDAIFVKSKAASVSSYSVLMVVAIVTAVYTIRS